MQEDQARGRTTPNFSTEANPGRTAEPFMPQERPLYTPRAPQPPKKQEPVRAAAVQTGAAYSVAAALVLIMKYVFHTDLSIADAVIIVGAVVLVANFLSGEVARLRVWAPEK